MNSKVMVHGLVFAFCIGGCGEVEPDPIEACDMMCPAGPAGPKGPAGDSFWSMLGGVASFEGTSVHLRTNNNDGFVVSRVGPEGNYDNYLYMGATDGAGAAGYVRIGGYSNSGGGRNLVLEEAGGNVGIGVTAPEEKLHVAGKVVADPTYGAANTDSQFITSSTSFVDLPGLAVNVTTHGKPVMLTVNTNLNPATGYLGSYSSWGVVTITRDGTNLGNNALGLQIAGAAQHDNLPVSFTFVDVPPAGSHIYRVQVRAGEANVGLIVGEAGVRQQLAAVELN